MNFNLDYCIISNPFNEKDNFIVYFTRRNEVDLDHSLRNEEQYIELLDFMRSIGYVEVDYFAFEYSNEIEEQKELGFHDLNNIIQEQGAQYNHKFEELVKSNIEILKQTLEQDYLGDPSKSFYNKNYKIPEVGEKINLYFYFLLETVVKDKTDPYLRLNCDFDSRHNTAERNFLKILNTSFVRVETENEGYLKFSTLKGQKDLIKEINFLHGGIFKILLYESEGSKNKRAVNYFYSILELKNKFHNFDKISLEIPEDKFNLMMDLSYKIREENRILEKENFSKEEILANFNALKIMARNKMLEFAEAREYFNAKQIRDDLKVIEKKEKIFNKKLNRDLTKREYDKLFTFS